MRWLPIGIATALAAGCVSQGLAPGALNPDWQEPRRDPDPTRDPTREQSTSPWIEDEAAGGAARAPDSPRAELAKRSIAAVAGWLAGGWLPLLVWHGTFEEDPNARAAHRRATEEPAEPGEPGEPGDDEP